MHTRWHTLCCRATCGPPFSMTNPMNRCLPSLLPRLQSQCCVLLQCAFALHLNGPEATNAALQRKRCLVCSLFRSHQMSNRGVGCKAAELKFCVGALQLKELAVRSSKLSIWVCHIAAGSPMDAVVDIVFNNIVSDPGRWTSSNRSSVQLHTVSGTVVQVGASVLALALSAAVCAAEARSETCTCRFCQSPALSEHILSRFLLF